MTKARAWGRDGLADFRICAYRYPRLFTVASWNGVTLEALLANIGCESGEVVCDEVVPLQSG
jgi:hypothetical protein